MLFVPPFWPGRSSQSRRQMAEPFDIRQALNLPPEEAVRFMAAKGYRLTTNWQEMRHEDHDRAFTAAKIARLQILEALREELHRSQARGETYQTFLANVKPRLVDLGWWGPIEDASITGTPDLVVVNPARLRRIYDTNMRTARAAALWKRIWEGRALMPYLRYSAVLDRRTRPEHRAWHDIVLPVEHPWWQTHFPPNGWNCRCTVLQMNERMLARRKLSVTPDTQLPTGTRSWRRRDGAGGWESIEVPAGIDPGWSYAPGADYLEGLKPPPLEGAIARPAVNARGPDGPLAPLPPPRKLPDWALLPRDTSDEEAITTFLESFNDVAVDRRGARVFVDALGEPVVLSRDFFVYPDGTSKLRADRIEAINLLAMALQDPDEIWWVWEEVNDGNGATRFRLTRRYVAQFVIDGRTRTALTVLEVGRDGWRGVSAFAGRAGYADKEQVRGGVLAYRRVAAGPTERGAE